jgi:hypothetical protein
MTENIVQFIILVSAIVLWAYSAFPTLKYIVYASEGSYRWPLAGWFALLTASIFLLKFSLFAITGWPGPGTWASRLFFPGGLALAYLLPFAKEYLVHGLNRPRK